ncbi:PQQ-binding-like beta-propeller repeat protein, partial [Acidobacteria bacterium AH-259-D05]|nr:PQQ-binding-like beta-propeller repeat protein [Acidobacteria bacterium AH-259-D05]
RGDYMGEMVGLGSWTRRKFLKGVGAAGTLMAMGPVAKVSKAYALNPPQAGPTDWPRFGYDLHNTRFNSLESRLGRENVSRLKLKWSFHADGVIQTTPTVIGDTLFFGSQSGHQYALETNTGEPRWKFAVEKQQELRYMRQGIRSSSQYWNGRVYFGDNMTKVHSVDAATGQEIWQTQLTDDPSAQTRCSPALYNGKVIMGYSSARGNAEIVCLDAETGAVCWRFKTAPEGAGGSVWASPAIDEKEHIVYNATGSAKAFMPPGPMLYTESILAHDLESGELLWYSQARRASPHDLDFGCHPMIFDAKAPSGYRGDVVRNCVAAGSKGGFFTWDRYTGELYWKVMLTNASAGGGLQQDSTAVAYNRIFAISTAVTGKGSMSVTAALHAYTGDIVWWVPNSAPNHAPVAVANGVFYQGLMDGTLQALDAETGGVLWEYKLPTAHRGGIAIANGTLYASNGEPSRATEEVAKTGRYSIYAFSIDGE